MVITRRRGTLRRLAAALAVLVTALVVGLTTVPSIARAEGEASLGIPEHTKSIQDNGDRTYTVTLDVKGATDESSDTVNKPVDIVLVVDQSSSMNDGNRMENVRNAAIRLANSVLADNADAQVRISVVLFGTYTQDKWGNPKVGGSGWLTSADAVANEIPTVAPNDATGIFSNGNGTNWEAGLRDASNVLQTARADADKYVIFLSDGELTYRLEDAGSDESAFDTVLGRYFDRTTGERVYWIPRWIPFVGGRWTSNGSDTVDAANVEYVEGTGNTNPGGVNSQAALGIAQQINQNATFFSVSAESGTDDLMRSFHQQVTGSTDGFYSAGDAGSLNEAFDDISSIIRSEASYRNVTITDTLSQWATGVSPEGVITSDGRVDPDTFTYMKDGQVWNDAPTATVGEDGKITWVLGENFTLEDGVMYSVSFKIAPNQAAYDDAAQKGQATEYLSNGEANVSYTVYRTVNGEPSGDPEFGTDLYDSPSMTVPVSTLRIAKVWDGTGAKPESITVDVYQDGKQYEQVTLTDDGNGTWSADVVVSAGPKGHTYTLSEVDPGDGWTNGSIVVDGSDDSSVKLTGLTAQSTVFTVTNVPESFSLWVTKTDSADPSMVLNGATFDLYKADDNGAFVQDDDHKVSEGTVGGEGKRAQFDGLTLGTYYLLETSVPAGYQLRTEPYKIVVSTNGIQFAKTVDGTLSDASAVDGQDRTYQVSFENTKVAGGEIPDTGGIGDVPLYTAGVMAVAGSVLAARRVRSH